MTGTDPILARYRDTMGTSPTRGGSTRWREELVELLVLAEHGDSTAAARLRDWEANDSARRAVSQQHRQRYRSVASSLS
jgi:hypothetical protein